MADIVLLGSPYVYGKAVEPRKPMFSYRIDTPITIGDTCPGKELRWVEASGLLVAQSDVLAWVCRKQLSINGLDQECTLTIDGGKYKYQLLHAAPGKAREPCEWEALQQAYPGVWIYDLNLRGFFGQEGAYLHEGGFSKTVRPEEGGFGWRPVLERIVELTPDMVGKCLWVSTEQGSLQGELVEITDYDLLFRKVSATNLPWEHISPLPGGSMIMEKMAVKQVKEVPKNG